MSKQKLSNNSAAVVTGAGSGIGRAYALEIARRGGRVICADIHEESAQETAHQVEALGSQAWAITSDVTCLKSVEVLAGFATDKLGQTPTLIINNAGIGAGGRPLGSINIEDWQATIDVNLWGVIHGCHVFTPLLRKQGYGGIINVASAASFAALPMMGPYNVSKAGVLALSETLSAELSGSGVRVNVVCPTFVKTNIINNARLSSKPASQLGDRVMKKAPTPDGIVRKSLNALDKGQLYMLPQLDARAVWSIKRHSPRLYGLITAWLARRATAAA